MASIYIAIKNQSQAEPLPNEGSELLIHFDFISSIGEESNIPRLDDYVFTPTEQISEFLKKSRGY